jgi:hypothetical protein
MTFPAGDALGARLAIRELMQKPALRDALVEGARQRDDRWSPRAYREGIDRIVRVAIAEATH